MAYKSKEQYPLINNPKKKTYCHIDPRTGRKCSVHFHKDSLKGVNAASDAGFASFDTWNDPFADDTWREDVGGYGYDVLMNDFGFTADEMTRFQNYPPKRGVQKETTPDNELFLAYQDRSRRQYMSPELQAAIVMKRIEDMEPELKAVRDALYLERQNKEYPGNNSYDGNYQLAKSSKYYELIGKEHKLFEERAQLMQNAGYALGWNQDGSSYESVTRALKTSANHSTQVVKDEKGVYVTYWSNDYTQLSSALGSVARSDKAKGDYKKQIDEYFTSIAASKNKGIRQNGTNDWDNRIKPSERLIEARVEFAIKKKFADKAQAAFDSSNIFNRRSRKKALDKAKMELSSANMTLNSRELE